MNDPHPVVSVVIPCFNQSRYLRAAIESVLRQSYAPVELIVVDDGSTDDTADVAAAAGAIVLSQPNRGLSEARNAGLAAARGELVVFLDADDELLPEAVAMGVSVLAARPDAAAVAGRCQSMDAEGRPLPARHHVVDESNLYHAWLSNNFVWTPGAAMFRRAALTRIGGFPPDLGPAADYAVYLQLARSGGFLYRTHDVVRYRQHDASMSRDSALMLRTTLKVLRRERTAARRPVREAIRRGERTWRGWYGEQIIERLRSDWIAGRRGRTQLVAGLTLLRYCPSLVLRRAPGKVRRLLAAGTRRARERALASSLLRRRRTAP